MIISNNRKPSIEEFSSLVFAANDYLNCDAKKREKYYATRNAQKLEDDVAFALSVAAQGTVFQDTIVKVSGQKFPDIVANKYYGVEVKSSNSENWITLGGSVNESTRIDHVERIFLTFGKLSAPIEFKSRPYEDCLSEVIVTHYPRYKINMNLSQGETIFDKMKTTYDELRNGENPVGDIVAYYKKQLKDGESLWWMDTAENTDNVSSSASMTVRLWRTLSCQEKHDLMISGYAFFPSILSNHSTKYEDFSLWLASHHSTISTSMRDIFSAGGQETICTNQGIFYKVPQVLYKIFCNREEIEMQIIAASESFLKESWKVTHIKKDRISQWIDLISSACTIKDQNRKQILDAIFKKEKE